jgi:spermidine/putrescine transport system ATP-binding protein
VTHDQEEALTMSDRIAVMNEGRVEQIGAPQEIYHSPASVFVANFIGIANLLPGVVTRVGGDRVSVKVAGDGEVSLPAGADPVAPGAAVTVMVRPERLRLTGKDAGTNGVPVTVRHVVFQGPVIRCILVAPEGTEIVAHVGPAQAIPDLAPGLELRVSWDPDAARLLPPAKHAAPVEADLNTTVERAALPIPNLGGHP